MMDLFHFDLTKARAAIEDPDGAIWPVNSYSDADELHSLVEATIDSDLIRCPLLDATLYVYPLSVSEPDPLLAVDHGSGPTLLGHQLRLRERDGESPPEYTLRLLEEVTEEANALCSRFATGPLPHAGSLEEGLRDIASELPTEEEWRSAADFMEYACGVLDRLGIERPARYEDC
jgi:hypothetical protein